MAPRSATIGSSCCGCVGDLWPPISSIIIAADARDSRAAFQPRFHAGIWLRPGRYSCCLDVCRWSMGCQLVAGVADIADNAAVSPWQPETVVALHGFAPLQTGQLSLTRGERYALLDCSHGDWWYLRDAGGDDGYAPRTHVQRLDALGSHDWFHGDVSRQAAESRLYEEGREGCFLVRCSASGGSAGDCGLTLSLLTGQSGQLRVHHYRIRQLSPVSHSSNTSTRQLSSSSHGSPSAGPYYLSEKHVWPSVPELVEYHRYNAGGLVVRLRCVPCGTGTSRTTDCPASAVGLDQFEVDVADLRLERTPIGQGQFGVSSDWLL